MNDFDFSLILAARERLAKHIARTPLLNSPMLDRALGCELFVKAEPLQKTGSFKIRGALNMILQLSPDKLARGVVAYSSGNHGHGVAAAAKMAGTSAVIVLPKTAPVVKIESCRWWGAEVVTYDPATQVREEIVGDYIEKAGRTLIPPFDHYAIMAGQGTAGLEIGEEMQRLGKRPDAVIAPCSGGGLASGIFTAIRERFPNAEAFIVEPAGYDKMARSLATGSPQSNAGEAQTIMDALVGRHAGAKTVPILKALAARPLTVSDGEAMAGMYAAFRYLKLVVEPGGAAAMAALAARKIDLRGKCVIAVCSGGNVDAALFARAISQAAL